MLQAIEVIYEDNVFKPVTPIKGIKEHEKISLVIFPHSSREAILEQAGILAKEEVFQMQKLTDNKPGTSEMADKNNEEVQSQFSFEKIMGSFNGYLSTTEDFISQKRGKGSGRMTEEIYILDACALIAFLNGEKGAEVVLSLLDKARNINSKILLHAISLCEVYYDCFRTSGKTKADELLNLMEKLPLEIVYNIDIQLLKETGKLKASEKISLADAFALALSIIHKGTIVTSDHSEFDPLEKKGTTKFLWIR